jgi:hypothetical protein
LSCIRIGTAGYAGGEFLVVDAADDANPDSHGVPRISYIETLSPLLDDTQLFLLSPLLQAIIAFSGLGADAAWRGTSGAKL